MGYRRAGRARTPARKHVHAKHAKHARKHRLAAGRQERLARRKPASRKGYLRGCESIAGSPGPRRPALRTGAGIGYQPSWALRSVLSGMGLGARRGGQTSAPARLGRPARPGAYGAERPTRAGPGAPAWRRATRPRLQSLPPLLPFSPSPLLSAPFPLLPSLLPPRLPSPACQAQPGRAGQGRAGQGWAGWKFAGVGCSGPGFRRLLFPFYWQWARARPTQSLLFLHRRCRLLSRNSEGRLRGAHSAARTAPGIAALYPHRSCTSLHLLVLCPRPRARLLITCRRRRPRRAPPCLRPPLAARRQALESFTPRQLRLMFVLQPWERKMSYGEQASGCFPQMKCILETREKIPKQSLV